MTGTEIEIVKAEFDFQEKLLAETVANKSYAGAMASIAAVAVIEWLKISPQPYPVLVIVAVGCLAASAILFSVLCRSWEFSFPSESENWIAWRSDREKELVDDRWPDTSDEDLKDRYYGELKKAVANNRELVASRQRTAEAAGLFAMVPVLIVVANLTWRFIFS